MSYASPRSYAEKHEPDHTEDQYREAGGDEEQSKHRRPRLGLPRFGWRFDNVALLLCCHGALGSLMLRQVLDVTTKPGGAFGTAYREQRTISDHVPNFEGCFAMSGRVSGKNDAGTLQPIAMAVNAVRRFLNPGYLKLGSLVVSSGDICCVFGVSHGSPCQLEGLFAPFARDLPGRPLSGDIGY